MKIETERLILRPFCEEDLDHEFSILGNAETMAFYPRPYTKEEVCQIISKNIRTFKDSGYGLFAVTERESGDYVGDCGITLQIIDGKEELEVGYRIRKESWGQGIAQEAARAMIQYGFERLKLVKLCSYMPKSIEENCRKSRDDSRKRISKSEESKYPNNSLHYLQKG